jgi:hypothetical protein
MSTHRHLPLTFPMTGAAIAMGNANGYNMRYEINHVGRAKWRCIIEKNGAIYTVREFPRRQAAKAFARADFMRRQLVKELV